MVCWLVDGCWVGGGWFGIPASYSVLPFIDNLQGEGWLQSDEPNHGESLLFKLDSLVRLKVVKFFLELFLRLGEK